MTFTKYQFNNFCYWPSNPKKIVEFIGGSYLASKPDLTYRRFIESLINKNYAVHAYKYTPQFDHQQLCLLYTSPSPRDQSGSRMPSSA